jgi:hypothetical protein
LIGKTLAHYEIAGLLGRGGMILTNELPPADQSKVGALLIQNWSAALKR